MIYVCLYVYWYDVRMYGLCMPVCMYERMYVCMIYVCFCVCRYDVRMYGWCMPVCMYERMYV